MSFPSTRMRRMRADEFSRRLMRETVNPGRLYLAGVRD